MAKTMKVAAGLGAASVIAVSGAALANSQTTASSSSTSSTSSTSTQQTAPAGDHHGGRMHGTEVTGTALTSVKNAVKAKDAAVSIDHVFKESNGTYDALGTKAGKHVFVKVSSNFKTVTEQTGGPGMGGRGHGGPGGHMHGTPVTGTTLTSVKAAIKAKDSAVTVQGVVKESDGSYDAFGTKAGKRVHVEISKDLKTVSVKTDDHAGRGPRGGFGAPGQNTQAPSSSATSSATANA